MCGQTGFVTSAMFSARELPFRALIVVSVSSRHPVANRLAIGREVGMLVQELVSRRRLYEWDD